MLCSFVGGYQRQDRNVEATWLHSSGMLVTTYKKDSMASLFRRCQSTGFNDVSLYCTLSVV
jgi:hypothetical protein